jgi:hypothetical protein
MENILLPLYDSDGNAYEYTVTEVYKFGSEELQKSGYSMSLAIDNASSSHWSLETTASENVWKLSLKDTASVEMDEVLALTAVNTLKSGSFTVNKVWDDDQNREADRKAVTVQLYRDGEAMGDEVTLDTSNDWSYTWNDLPVYQKNGTDKSFYTLIETNAESNWTVKYENGAVYDESDKTGHGINLTENGTIGTTITNEITPDYFTVSATKKWEDADDEYHVSPSYIWVKLQYSTDKETWRDVESTPDTEDYSNGTKVYTSSNLKQKILISRSDSYGTENKASWSNLPEKVRVTNEATGGESKTVYYRVVECEAGDDGKDTDTNVYYTQNSGVVSYADAVGEDEKTADVVLTNTLPMGSISVSKSWDDVDADIRPDKIVVKLYYKINGEDVELAEKELTRGEFIEDNWNCSFGNLPVYDSNHEKIQYSVEEELTVAGYTVYYSVDNANWSETKNVLTLNENETSDTYIKNVQERGSVTVNKAWSDSGFESERPENITYYLYRGSDLYRQETVKVEADGSASYKFADLPVYDAEGKAYIYKVVEDFDGYTATYDRTECTLDETPDVEILVTNTIKLGSIEINDENNRENKRSDIVINIYRDGDETPYRTWSSENDAEVDEKDNWKCIFTDLPVAQNGGQGLSVYRIEEVCEDASYTASWSDTIENLNLSDGETISRTVTNTYVPEKTSFTVTKQWKDYDDRYNKRPDSIYLTLMYRIDGSDEWKMVTKADGETTENGQVLYADGGVYTTSDAIQEIKTSFKANGNTQEASWENLPEKVLIDGVIRNVTYQVFETDAEGTSLGNTTDSYDITYEISGKDETIINKLNPNVIPSNTDNVKTGDDSKTLMWMLMMAGAFISMLYAGMWHKKKKEEK